MAFPEQPLTIHGGCSCKAFRYKITIPSSSERPLNPYWSNAQTKQDRRMPMIAICHCNDCRLATGSLLPVIMAADLSWVSVSVASKDTTSSGTEHEETWVTAEELLDYEDSFFEDRHLSFYRSSPGRRRWFCGRCGTHTGYNIDPGFIPPEWGWPRMIDIWLGTIDREDLEHEWMKPDTQVYCHLGIDWVKGFVMNGDGNIQEPDGLSAMVKDKQT